MKLRLRTTSKFKRLEERLHEEPGGGSEKEGTRSWKVLFWKPEEERVCGWVWGEGSEQLPALA